MTLQVIAGLKPLGASPSSTFVIPMEFTRLLGQVGDYLDQRLQSSANRTARWQRARIQRPSTARTNSPDTLIDCDIDQDRLSN